MSVSIKCHRHRVAKWLRLNRCEVSLRLALRSGSVALKKTQDGQRSCNINNDGCAVARSNEAKALGIAMGEPAFKIRHLVEEAGLVMLSSNYALYGDMSARVMSVLATFAPAVEVYSIDECFLDLAGMPQPDLTEWARQLRATVRQWTGIPVSVGVAQTKTLAKLANRLAKKSKRADGALDLTANPAWIETALKRTDVADVWGIGRQFAGHCYTAGIRTAWDLSRAEDGWVRKVMGKVGLRTVMELRGTPVHTMKTEPAARQTCCCSRSFGEATQRTSTCCRLTRIPSGKWLLLAKFTAAARHASPWKTAR